MGRAEVGAGWCCPLPGVRKGQGGAIGGQGTGGGERGQQPGVGGATT